jgi:serine/threonine protein kinase/Tol biopolymer transport system component
MMEDLSGKRIDRFQILAQLGQGGMATVYKARDTRLDRDVAIKLIRYSAFPPEMLDRILVRFEREAKSLARLSHPNIVKVHDYGEYESSPYLVLEYLPGGDLKMRLNGKQLGWREAIHLILPIARALRFSHQQGIIHRDIKPSNILFTSSEEPMISDFGIAKILDYEDSATLTGTGVGIGTPGYMAPEQWTGTTSPFSDQYGLGVVLYEMITGHKPYEADTPAGILVRQTTESLPRPRKFVPDLPIIVEQVLFKVLAKEPADRYKDMEAFAKALESLLTIPVVQTESDSDKTVGAGPILPTQRVVETPTTLIKENQAQEISGVERRPLAWLASIMARNPFLKKKDIELPAGLLKLMHSPNSSIRKDAIKELGALLRSHDSRLAALARLKLEEMKEDDSRTVSVAADKTLSEFDGFADEQKNKLELESTDLVEKTTIAPVPIKERGPGWMPKIEMAGFKKSLAEPKNWPVITVVLIFFVAVIGFALYTPISRTSLFYSGASAGEVNIYWYDGKNISRITQSTAGVRNWSPASGIDGNIYFTSNRSGKAEIYRLNRNGEVVQVTHTPGKAESWSPVIQLQDIYFTSNRDGKTEIYRLSNGKTVRVTNTPGKAESWSPVVHGQITYFTSNRDGKAEIYRLDNGKIVRVTQTPGKAESWSPTVHGQTVYFASNRDGKTEIYRLDNGKIVRVTQTPDKAESWSPVIQGKDIYFTSNRSGRNEIYLLEAQPVVVTEFESWTGKLNDKDPGY